MVRETNHIKNLLSNHRDIVVCLLFVIALMLVYAPAIKSGYIWDDDYYITNNLHLRSWDGLKNIWFKLGATPQYYPMVHNIFWLEYHLWELNPFGYHLINVLFHAANAFLLWMVLRRLGISGSLFIAAVFAFHPVQVESVAWITEYKNTVSGFFYLSAILIYLRFYKLGETYVGKHLPDDVDFEPKDGRGSWKLYVLGLLLYMCALLSKTVAATMPAVLILLLWWKRERLRLNDILLLVPFFLLSTVFGLVTIWVEKYNVGAIGEEWSLSIIDRFLVAGRALWFYAGKLLWPQKLTFTYPRWEINSAIWWQYLFPVTAASVIAVLWLLRRRIGKAPLVAVLFFSGTLFPALGFFNVYPHRFSFVADHFQYLASIGIIALVVSVGMKIFSKLGHGKTSLGLPSGLIVIAILGIFTWKQGHIYKDRETLYRDTIAKNDTCWMAYNNLGVELDKQGRLEEAMDHYLKALQIKPDYVDAHYSLGVVLEKQGRIEEAMDHYLQALRINPNYLRAQYNIGLSLSKQGRLDEAVDYYLQALRINPGYEDAHYNLANILSKQGRTREAIDHYRQVLQINPDYAEAHNNLGLALEIQGRTEEAMDHFLQALRIRPDYVKASYNLGLAFYRKGNIEEAIAYFRRALRIDPDDIETMYHLAKLYVGTSEYEEALILYQKLIVLLPDNPAVDYNIACIYARQNNSEKSVHWLKKAVAKGFNDLEHIKNDSDLDNIRDSSHYREFLANH